jgi:NAD(P)-dependent dehydrogenase (short-subunit alcohol dehydrogenase family)
VFFTSPSDLRAPVVQLPKAHIFEEFSLKDRVAVVTGAWGGLGLEMSLALAELGAKVYGFDLPKEASGELVSSRSPSLGPPRRRAAFELALIIKLPTVLLHRCD